MAATIQTIQKPTRARALDTSTSEQIVTSNLVSGDDSTFAAGTGVWSGVRGTAAHDTNQLKFTTDNTYHTDANTMSSYPIGIYDANFFASGQPGDDIAVGDRVKVKFTAKHSSTSNLDCAVPFGYIGESVLGDSDLKVISNPNMTTSYQDYEFNFTRKDSEAMYIACKNVSGLDAVSGQEDVFFIDTIEVYKLENFPSNNHGQIYSGRALEFDGVSDKLNFDSILFGSTDKFTISTWMKAGSTTVDSHILCGKSDEASANTVWIDIPNQDIRFRNSSGTDHLWEDSISKDLSWNHYVIVANGDNSMNAYQNGVSLGTSGESVVSTIEINEIGGSYSSGAQRLNGSLSNFEIWDEAWSADDALYDYNNPESLALNRGGTSLTESNLKLWYPMQDGHRGQQSFILDGANTGLGDDVLGSWTDGAGDPSSFSWTTWSSSGTTVTSAISDGGNDISTNPFSAVAGRTYKLTMNLTLNSGSNYPDWSVREGNTGTVGDGASFGTAVAGVNTGYWTAPSTKTMYFFVNSGSATQNFSLSDVSVKPVNAKNHATTVFYGDNLYTAANAATVAADGITSAETDAASELGSDLVTNGDMASATGWTLGTNWSIGSGVLTGSSATVEAEQQGILVIGQTYKITWTIASLAGGTVKLKCGSGTAGTIQTGTGTFTEYLTCSGSTHLAIAGHSAFSGTIDNVSCQVVNTGWVEMNSGTSSFGSTGGAAHTGSKSMYYIADANGGGMYTDLSDYMTVGRTYQLSCYVRHTGSGGNQRLKLASDTGLANDSTTIATIASGDTTFAQQTQTFVYSTNFRYFGGIEDSGTDNGGLYIDSLSIKEVGTATGWTDADQQLDIPQTALQSYNQLAWFDGAADLVQLSDPYNHTSITVSAWVSFVEDASTKTIFNNEDEDSDGMDFVINLSEKLVCTVNGTDCTSSQTLSEGEWYHVVATWDGTTIKLYVNGGAETTASKSGTMSATTNARLGKNAYSDAYWLNGAITEVSIWAAALSLAEVQELYNDGIALDATIHSKAITASTNLKGYFRNNGLATWTDLSDDYSNNGTVTASETLLIPAGVDGSRDNQGFLMNRQKDTNALNLNWIGSSPISDGTHVAIGNYPEFNFGASTDFTVSLWAKYTDDGYMGLVSKGVGGVSGGWEVIINQNTGKLQGRIEITDGSARINQISGSEYNDGEWHNFVVVYDRDANITVYIDKVADGTYSIASIGDCDADHNLIIGKQSTLNYPFNGEIDDVLIYNKALSLPEITRNYNAGKRSHR